MTAYTYKKSQHKVLIVLLISQKDYEPVGLKIGNQFAAARG